MKNKTIDIVIENFLYGGTTTHLLNFINSKTCKNYKFRIITNKNNVAIQSIKKTCDMERVKIVQYQSFNYFQLQSYSLKIIFFIFKPILFLISIIQMFILLKNAKTNIILLSCGGYGDFRSEMAAAISTLFLPKKKVFLLIHHCYLKPKLWNFLINLVNRLISKLVVTIIFVSNSTRRSIQNNTNLVNKNTRYKIIYNGVNVKRIKTKNLKQFKTKKGIIKIGILSRIEEYKGHLDLIYAFSDLTKKEKEKFKVFLIGNGSDKFVNRLKNLIFDKELNKYFKIINFINEESFTIFRNLDLTLSLTKDFEGFGYSIAESLYAETPVISTDVGGVSEYLNNEVANVIKSEEKGKITMLLRDFLINKKAWKKKAKLGKKLIINHFNSEKMSKEFLKVLK